MKPKRIIREAEFRSRLGGCSHSTFWRRQQTDPNFPAKVRLGPNSVGFYDDEVDAYIGSLPRVGAEAPN
jgi:predicted DNA-binding transcriptional regulator AlpA